MESYQFNNFSTAGISEYLYGSYIKGINTRDLEATKENFMKLSKKLNIPFIDLLLKKNWYLYNGEYYYFKKMSIAMRILNELLGEYLSKYMNLPTVEYILALDYDKVVGLLSKNFRRREKRYLKADEVNRKTLKPFSVALNKHEIDDFRKTLDRLIMKDFYSCLMDRGRNTLISVSKLKGVSLEESFDYELSFVDEREKLESNISLFSNAKYDTYYSPLFRSKKLNAFYEEITYDTLREMLEYDDYLNGVFEYIMNFNMKKALLDVEDAHNLKIDREMKDYYINFDRARKQELRSALNK